MATCRAGYGPQVGHLDKARAGVRDVTKWNRRYFVLKVPVWALVVLTPGHFRPPMGQPSEHSECSHRATSVRRYFVLTARQTRPI